MADTNLKLDTASNGNFNAFEQARSAGTAQVGTDLGKTYTANPSTVTLPTPSTPNVPIADVKPATPLSIPTSTPDTSLADSSVAGVAQGQKSLQDYIKELTPPETTLGKEQSGIMDRIKELLPSTLGKGTALVNEEAKNGVPDLKKQLSDINAQILTKNAEYEKLNTNIEGKAIPMQFITGQQAQVRRQQASEINLLQARALGLQGQVTAAMDTAKRAVDLKYQDAEDEIAMKEKQLKLIEPNLTKEEAIVHQAQTQILADQKERLNEQKNLEKQNLSLAIKNNIQESYFVRGGDIIKTSDGSVVGSIANGIAYKADGTPYKDEGALFADLGISNWSDIGKIEEPLKYETRIINKVPYRIGFDGKGNMVSKTNLQTGVTQKADSTTSSSGKASGVAPLSTPTPNSKPKPTTSKMDSRVKQIIATHPGEYGQAADAIDAEFGAGTASKYDNLLKTKYLVPANARDLAQALNGQTLTKAQRQKLKDGFIQDHAFAPKEAAAEFERFVSKKTQEE